MVSKGPQETSLPSQLKLPRPEEWAQRMAQRSAKAAKVPEILAKLEKLDSDYNAQQKVLESLMMSMLSPYGMPSDEILDALELLDDEQKAALKESLKAIFDVIHTLNDTNDNISKTVEGITTSIASLATTVRNMPVPQSPAPSEKVDIGPQVDQILMAINKTGERITKAVDEMEPAQTGFQALQFEVIDRDKAGAIKKVKVSGV